MRNIRLIVEYDGTAYAGWQVQPNGVAVQELLEGALAKIAGHPVRLLSSGRTDAGVHARGMVASFTTDRDLPLSAFSDGVNSLLPPDIAVREAADAPADFHPRFAATGKRYRYTLHLGARRSPLARLYAWHLKGGLDVERLAEAAGFFVGEHDFASFRTAGCAARTTTRRIDAVTLVREGELLHIDVTGSGFLRNMVRLIVGTLVAVGQGRLSPATVARCLTEPGTPAGPTAPAHGLTLLEVFYDRPGE